MSATAKRLLVVALACAATVLAIAAPAVAFRLGPVVAPVAGNPADGLASLPADPEAYDPATHCAPKPHPGMVALVAWLGRNARGTFWGSYRCEKWGPHEASLHAENRAVDWHLDVSVPADRAAARKPIDLLLAPHRTGPPPQSPPTPCSSPTGPACRPRSRGGWASRRSSGTAATGAPACRSSSPTRRAWTPRASASSTSTRRSAT